MHSQTDIQEKDTSDIPEISMKFAPPCKGVYTNKFCCRHLLAVWCSQCGLHSDNMHGEHWGKVPLKINMEAKKITHLKRKTIFQLNPSI